MARRGFRGRKMKLASLLPIGILLLASVAVAEERDKAIQQTEITLGTATPGGGFPLYGNAFAEVMNAADPSLLIKPPTPRAATRISRCSKPGRSKSRWWRASLPMKPSWGSADVTRPM